MHRDMLHLKSQTQAPARLGCFRTRCIHAAKPRPWVRGGYQLPLVRKRHGLAHIQARGMRPNQGLKTLKCSFSEGWTFLRCQKNLKRQLASLSAAWAKQPGLQGLTWHKDAFGDPTELDNEGVPAQPPHRKSHSSPASHQVIKRQVGSQGLAKQQHHLPPMLPSHGSGKKRSKPHWATFSICQ